MDKRQLRANMLAKLQKQAPSLKEEADKRLLAAVLASPSYQDSQVIATYLSFSHEYDTKELIAQALADGKRVLIPKTYPKGEMIFCPYHPDELIRTSFGLWEPARGLAVAKSQIDLIHVPGLLFNQAGFRIGYGGGYYDRYLETFKGNTISTAYQFQLVDFEEERHDIPVEDIFYR
ncbi:5-formyltetrahydrofolate cyclo-ligase [Streptococcus sp. zg-JUN1979]|uniref:5-formyltetrahydrofolate cyclo-ligase n=1 Tax=Streptococcus sp. zg-JUN1979 TaxID=3391450 RepID=UPI0039A555C7